MTLHSTEGSKNVLYGYLGSGLYKAHPSWWSLVVRSREGCLTKKIVDIFNSFKHRPGDGDLQELTAGDRDAPERQLVQPGDLSENSSSGSEHTSRVD